VARFAAIGLDHRHVCDMTQGLLAAGQECAGHCPETTDPRVLAGFRKRFPGVPAVGRERLLDDPSIDVVVTAAIPRDRAALAIEAMRRGRDVMAASPASPPSRSWPRSSARSPRRAASGRSASAA
jgi:predicted dehydrogenase